MKDQDPLFAEREYYLKLFEEYKVANTNKNGKFLVYSKSVIGRSTDGRNPTDIILNKADNLLAQPIVLFPISRKVEKTDILFPRFPITKPHKAPL